MTNVQNFIGQSEPPAPDVIMVDKKIRTDVSLLSIGMGYIVNPENTSQERKEI